MKYPIILYFTYDTQFDTWIEANKNQLYCTFQKLNKKEEWNKIYDASVHLFCTYGNITDFIQEVEAQFPERLLKAKWFHIPTFEPNDDLLLQIGQLNEIVNKKFVFNSINHRTNIRPVFSLFTTCYNSYHKIHIAYASLCKQTLKDWEWVIIDDSPDDHHFTFLRTNFQNDKRVRIYRRTENSGSIGNVKNEAIALCRGAYVLEFDHDDELLENTLLYSYRVFEKYHDVGFVYMDFCNLFENGDNFRYSDLFGKGYCGYHCEKLNGKWVFVENTPNINNVTLSHLVCMPNHPRIWRKSTLLLIGSYCENLPINDDQEIIMRTAVATKIARISKIGYVQYMNNNNNNFSLIRNAEINRIGPFHLYPMFYDMYKVSERMKELNAYEDQYYIDNYIQLWMRDDSYEHKFCNYIINPEHSKQYCVIGFEYLIKNKSQIDEIYNNSENELIVLDNRYSTEYLCEMLDILGYPKAKCYVLKNTPIKNLKKYFEFIMKSTNEYYILEYQVPHKLYNTDFGARHEIINLLTKEEDMYLEIGVEYGYTFTNTHFKEKIGVDPDPKFQSSFLILQKSDDFFEMLPDSQMFNCVFIDGMHQSDYVFRDFKNSLAHLSENGFIMIDDILPMSYNEQLRVPMKHYYEKGILKYGESWTGDVWKLVYYLLKNYSQGNKFEFSYYNHPNYRGVAVFRFKNPSELILDSNSEKIIEKMNSYDFFTDYEKYLELF